jgi:hypothetical protein
MKAAEISSNNIESSFMVYGDMQNYWVTRPLEEFHSSSVAGIDRHGIVYSKKGFGLFVPENKGKILPVHFHPPDNIAIPSEQDMRTHAKSSSSYPCFANSKIYVFNSVEGVAHNSNGEITVFFGQFSQPLNVSEETGSYLSALLDPLGVHGRIDIRDTELPYIAADIFNSTGIYRAYVMRFNDEESYYREVENMRDFEIFFEVTDGEPDEPELVDLLDVEALKRMEEELGIVEP